MTGVKCFCLALTPVSYTHLDVYKRQGFGIDYNLISAYAYRGIGEQNFNVRYASRGVCPRGYSVDFSERTVGFVLTDRVPDEDGQLYVKKYFGYPNFLTLFAKGSVSINMQSAMEVNVMYTGNTYFAKTEISDVYKRQETLFTLFLGRRIGDLIN